MHVDSNIIETDETFTKCRKGYLFMIIIDVNAIVKSINVSQGEVSVVCIRSFVNQCRKKKRGRLPFTNELDDDKLSLIKKTKIL